MINPPCSENVRAKHSHLFILQPGRPERGGVDLALNMAFDFNGTNFFVNNATFDPPPIPVLLQILSGKRAAQDLLPLGSVYPLPSHSSIEITFPATSRAPGGPHPFHMHGVSPSFLSAVSIITLTAPPPGSMPSRWCAAPAQPRSTTATPSGATPSRRARPPRTTTSRSASGRTTLAPGSSIATSTSTSMPASPSPLPKRYPASRTRTPSHTSGHAFAPFMTRSRRRTTKRMHRACTLLTGASIDVWTIGHWLGHCSVDRIYEHFHDNDSPHLGDQICRPSAAAETSEYSTYRIRSAFGSSTMSTLSSLTSSALGLMYKCPFMYATKVR